MKLLGVHVARRQILMWHEAISHFGHLWRLRAQALVSHLGVGRDRDEALLSHLSRAETLEDRTIGVLALIDHTKAVWQHVHAHTGVHIGLGPL